MKKSEVQIGSVYLKKVSGNDTLVKVTMKYGKGFSGINLKTNREVSIRSARGLTPLTESQIVAWKRALRIAE